MKLVIIVFIIAVFSSLCLSQPSGRRVCFENVCVQAEVADTESKRRLGLMFREGLAENQGMLFVFEEEGRHSFWMKNMKFPLDIIWIGEDKRIVEIRSSVRPCREVCESLIPKAAAKYALEVNAGFTDKNGIKTEDRVSFRDE